jgi:hypothetical protein
MPSVTISRLASGEHVFYDNGKFDGYCVYVEGPNNAAHAPRDIDYFEDLQRLGTKYGPQRLYDDFVRVYDCTKRTIEHRVLELIRGISASYGQDGAMVELILTVIYACMVAEENKEFAVLKKRIKRLGMHQLLVEGHPPSYAAHFSRGKRVRDLGPLCEAKGF